MSQTGEVPDHKKEQGHLVPNLDKWNQIRERADVFAAEDTEDIPVPDYAEDELTYEFPDEVSREETLRP